MDALDFGCGTGLLTLRPQPLARSITGMDSSPAMLEVLKDKIAKSGLANVHLQFCDLEHQALPDGSYNLVTSSMTLHHIRKTAPLLAWFFGRCTRVAPCALPIWIRKAAAFTRTIPVCFILVLTGRRCAASWNRPDLPISGM